VMRFPYWFPVDRHGLSALAMTRCVGNDMGGSVTTHTLSLRGGSGARDAAIHRVSREGDRVLRFGYNAHFVIARRERSEGRGNPSCLEGRRSGVAVRLLVPSGSPRASPAR